MSLPDDLMKDYLDGLRGTRDVDMMDTLHAILDDVVNSVHLALTSMSFSNATADEVTNTVRSYIVNNYGDD